METDSDLECGADLEKHGVTYIDREAASMGRYLLRKIMLTQ
jgi:hypothetical protein